MAETTANPQKKRNFRTLFALAFGYFIDQGEGQALSVLFPTLQKIWGLSYANLGTISTIRNILQAITAPGWGFAADKLSRKKVIIVGTGVWGLWTLACGLTHNYGQLLVVRAISGIGLGCLMPATFSLMSDTFPPERRGRALGTLEAFGTLGIVVGTLGIGFLASPELWRWGFIILGLLSIISGLLVWILVDEPVRGAAEPELVGKITEETAARYQITLRDIPKVLRIPTIWVAIGQGLAGTMPWVVLQTFFITFLVNDRGYDESAATIAFAAIVFGTVISNIIGGILGDWADRINPKYGRTIIGQIAILSGVPLSYVLLTQTEDWSFAQLVALCMVTALIISWPGKGSKEPMMQAVTPPELRSLFYSIDTFVESGFAAIVAVVAGKMADGTSLTEAMVWTVPVPWLICGLVFGGFYFTYPRDSAKLRAEMAARAEEISA